MSSVSVTDSPSRPAAGVLSVASGLVTAVLLIVAAYAGHDLPTYAALLASVALAWGWPVLMQAPQRAATSAVLVAGAIGCAVVVALSVEATDGVGGLSAVLAIALVLAFLLELLRTDGRQCLVLSLAGSAFGLAVVAGGAFYASAATHPFGEEAVAVVAGAGALTMVVEAGFARGRATEWGLPVALVGGAALGVAVGAASGGPWNILLPAGMATAGLGLAFSRVFAGRAGAQSAARVAHGVAVILGSGAVAYAAQWVINR